MPVHAQATATATANAFATVIEALSIITVRDLDFGDIIAASSPGTVVITPVNGAGNPGIVTPTLVTHLGNHHQAEFEVFGEPFRNVVMTLPATGITISSNSNSMLVDTFTQAGASIFPIPADGSFGFGVGATLHVGANQPTGFYTGTFDMTVSYQ
jgi:hypothetical protein